MKWSKRTKGIKKLKPDLPADLIKAIRSLGPQEEIFVEKGERYEDTQQLVRYLRYWLRTNTADKRCNYRVRERAIAIYVGKPYSKTPQA